MGLSVLILAGGRSRRMGRDKLWLPLDGVPLIRRVIERVLPLADEVMISANEPARFEAFLDTLSVPAQVLPDLYPGAGPLAGLHAGLGAMSGDRLLALGGDMPFVNLALVTHMADLAAGFDAVAPELPHPETGEPQPEPLHAVYCRACLPAVAARLARGDRRMVSFYGDVRLRRIPPAEIRRFDPELRSCFNVNTPAEWETAQRWLAEARAGRAPTVSD